jgi:hypothetical protein
MQEFLQNEDETARSRIERQFLASKRLHGCLARCSNDAQKPAMESHKDEQTFGPAAKLLHIGNDIISTSVADLELSLTQSFTDIQRAGRVSYLDIETMPFEDSFCLDRMQRKIVSGPELDQSKFCESHFHFLFVSALLYNDLSAAQCSLRPDKSSHNKRVAIVNCGSGLNCTKV